MSKKKFPKHLKFPTNWIRNYSHNILRNLFRSLSFRSNPLSRIESMVIFFQKYASHCRKEVTLCCEWSRWMSYSILIVKFDLRSIICFLFSNFSQPWIISSLILSSFFCEWDYKNSWTSNTYYVLELHNRYLDLYFRPDDFFHYWLICFIFSNLHRL